MEKVNAGLFSGLQISVWGNCGLQLLCFSTLRSCANPKMFSRLMAEAVVLVLCGRPKW